MSHQNYEDGTSFVTQCPIVPKETFTYNFLAEQQAVSPLIYIPCLEI
jgi:FtsP/CotA-like multicopper oxidase with cupredoxin domain